MREFGFQRRSVAQRELPQSAKTGHTMRKFRHPNAVAELTHQIRVWRLLEKLDFISILIENHSQQRCGLHLRPHNFWGTQAR